MTGEDPDAIPDEPQPKRQHSEPDSPERKHKHSKHHHDEPEQQRPAAADGRGPSGGRLADAWQAPGSLFSLLTSAEATAAAPAAAAADKDSKKKHKKEKHKKKDKVCLWFQRLDPLGTLLANMACPPDVFPAVGS